MAELGRDFWILETGTGQQVSQLHDRYDDDDDDVYKLWNFLLFYHDVLFTKLKKAQVCGGDIIHVSVLTLTQNYI